MSRPPQTPYAARRPLVVELVGPAGAGKSTLAAALRSLDPGVRQTLAVWSLPRGDLAAGMPHLAPSVIRALLSRRPLRAVEVAQMLRLEALRRTVQRSLSESSSLVLLDEGPIFALSWFDVFFGRNGDPGWSAWRRRMLTGWAGALDAVVRLDAGDAILADRIQTRPKPHPVKGCANPVIYEFSARFRRAFDRVIADLKRSGSVRVLQLRTDGAAPANMAHRVHLALEAIRER